MPQTRNNDPARENEVATIAIGPIGERDLPAMLEIHNDAVLHSTAIWSVRPADLAGRRALLLERQALGYPFLGAFLGEVLAGYATFGAFRPHDGYDRTVEHSIYVHKDYRRRGVAGLLLPRLIDAARACGKHVMVGGIDAANVESIRLHERFGFAIVGRLPQVGYKFDRYLDLVFMQKILADEGFGTEPGKAGPA